MYYIGMDLHKQDLVMAVEDEQGPVGRPRRIACREVSRCAARCDWAGPATNFMHGPPPPGATADTVRTCLGAARRVKTDGCVQGTPCSMTPQGTRIEQEAQRRSSGKDKDPCDSAP